MAATRNCLCSNSDKSSDFSVSSPAFLALCIILLFNNNHSDGVRQDLTVVWIGISLMGSDADCCFLIYLLVICNLLGDLSV